MIFGRCENFQISILVLKSTNYQILSILMLESKVDVEFSYFTDDLVGRIALGQLFWNPAFENPTKSLNIALNGTLYSSLVFYSALL